MSDHWIGIIPEDPKFVPSANAIAKAEALMAEIAPDADEIRSEISEGIRFQDCGENFISVHCPVCGAEIDTEWWREQMDRDYHLDSGFDLKPLQLPCGHRAESLNALRYDWAQGFSRFVLDTMNPMIGRALQPEEVTRLETTLGCPVKVIYRHI
jgi:hypothetical protein